MEEKELDTNVDKEKKATKARKTTKKNVTKTIEPEIQNNRFEDVIAKMEQETKKVNSRAKAQKKEEAKEQELQDTKKKSKKENNIVQEKATKNSLKTNSKKSNAKSERTKKANIKSQKETTKKVNAETKKVSKEQYKVESENKLIVRDNEINEQELEEIEEEIKKQTVVPEERMKKIYLRVFENIMYAIVILLYFILLCIGSKSIQKEVFFTDLKVFSIFTIVTTICMMEYAYKKDSARYTVHSIELLAVSIVTLFSLYFYVQYNSKFVGILTSIALIFAIYYVGKSIIGYIKRKRQALKKTSDIRKIAK